MTSNSIKTSFVKINCIFKGTLEHLKVFQFQNISTYSNFKTSFKFKGIPMNENTSRPIQMVGRGPNMVLQFVLLPIQVTMQVIELTLTLGFMQIRSTPPQPRVYFLWDHWACGTCADATPISFLSPSLPPSSLPNSSRYVVLPSCASIDLYLHADQKYPTTAVGVFPEEPPACGTCANATIYVTGYFQGCPLT